MVVEATEVGVASKEGLLEQLLGAPEDFQLAEGRFLVLVTGVALGGKGVLTKRLKSIRGVTVVSTGDELRRRKQAKADGSLGAEEHVLHILQAILGSADSDCIVIDGAPRTLRQAETLKILAKRLGFTVVSVAVDVTDDNELFARLVIRAAEEGREDDGEEELRRRIQLWREMWPVIRDACRGYFGFIEEVDGKGDRPRILANFLWMLHRRGVLVRK